MATPTQIIEAPKDSRITNDENADNPASGYGCPCSTTPNQRPVDEKQEQNAEGKELDRVEATI